MEKTATAQWIGSFDDGDGWISTTSGVLNSTPFSKKSRFEQPAGTSPEELIGAAHAACFTMALAAAVNKRGLPVRVIRTKATVAIDRDARNDWTVSSSELEVEAELPDIDHKEFQELVQFVKTTCPVSRLLNVQITARATLKDTGELARIAS